MGSISFLCGGFILTRKRTHVGLIKAQRCSCVHTGRVHTRVRGGWVQTGGEGGKRPREALAACLGPVTLSQVAA